MRRSEKEITDPMVIDSVLIKGKICRLGMIDGNSAYIVPMNYGFYKRTLYFHSAAKGKKIDLLKQNKVIAFEIDIDQRITRDISSCNWSSEYLSVIGTGRIKFINEENKKEVAMNIIMAKYSGRKDWLFDKKTLAGTLLFKLEIKEIFCKGSV